MSKTNPYASKKTAKKSTAEVASTTTAPVAEVSFVKEEELVVPTGSVNNILKWVNGDADKAKAAYKEELADKKRVSLLTQLKELF